MIYEIAALPAEPAFEPPPYGVPGSMLVQVLSIEPNSWGDRDLEIEVLDYDQDSSLFWLHEGLGFEWWLKDREEIDAPGWWVVEDVVGTYHRGDWTWGEDDDETWEYGRVRRATFGEMVNMRLDRRGATHARAE